MFPAPPASHTNASGEATSCRRIAVITSRPRSWLGWIAARTRWRPATRESDRGAAESVIVIAAGTVLVLALVAGDLGLDLVHVELLGLADELLECGGRERARLPGQ